MIYQMTQKARREKYNRLKSIVDKMELLPIIEEWNNYSMISVYEKDILWDQWNEYYKQARKTQAYDRYQKQRKALKKQDLTTVKELSEEAKHDLLSANWINKPSTRDPMEFYHHIAVIKYKQYKEEIEKLSYYKSDKELDKVWNT